jgi:hypothetical protein
MIDSATFIKGLKAAYFKDLFDNDLGAEGSIYFWWWSYLRISPVLWYANKTGLKPIDPQIRQVALEGGQIFRGDFDGWWSKNSERLFAEPNGRKEVRPLDWHDLRKIDSDRGSLFVEVPLSIPIERIMKSIKKILSHEHEGRNLDLASTSQALWPLKTMRFRVHAIEKQYLSLLYKSLYPKLAAVRIGDRLQLAPNLRIRGTSWMENELRYNRLNSISGRYIYTGKYTLLNAERGRFPDSSPINLPDDYLPFGKRHHKDFVAATALDAEAKSPWRQWLSRNLEDDLKDYVTHRNINYYVDTIADWKGEKFIDFYRGKSDLLP